MRGFDGRLAATSHLIAVHFEYCFGVPAAGNRAHGYPSRGIDQRGTQALHVAHHPPAGILRKRKGLSDLGHLRIFKRVNIVK